MAATQKQTPVPFKPLAITRRPTRANERRIEWDVTVEIDTKIEDLLEPSYWNHHSGNTFSGAYNFVNVYWEDKSKLARLFVRQFDSTFAKMEMLELHEFDKNAVLPVADKFEVSWSGPAEKHRVIRKADGQVIQSGFESKADAYKFVEEQTKLMK